MFQELRIRRSPDGEASAFDLSANSAVHALTGPVRKFIPHGVIREEAASHRFELPEYEGCSSMVHSVDFGREASSLLVAEHNRRTHALTLRPGLPPAVLTRRYSQGYMHTSIEGARFDSSGRLFYVQVQRSLYGHSVLEVRDAERPGMFTGGPTVRGSYRPEFSVSSADWSPNGRYIAMAGGLSRSICLMPVPAERSGKFLPCCEVEIGGIARCAAFHPSERCIIAAALQLGSVRSDPSQLEYAGTTRLHMLSLSEAKDPQHSSLTRRSEIPVPFEVNFVKVSPDGQTLVCAGTGRDPYAGTDGNCIAFYSIDAQSETLRPQTPCMNMDARVHCLAFSSDGRLLAIGTERGLTINDMHRRDSSNVPALQAWYVSPDEKDWVTAAAFSRDGARLAFGVGVRTGRVLVYEN